MADDYRNTVQNTTSEVAENPLGMLVASMGPGGPSQAVEEQERTGQAQIVNSTVLPTDGSENPELLELGLTFGDQVPDDPLFRHATLPDGWTRRGSDHAMHSYICDERGVRRVNVFYKAAFYDRGASISVLSPGYTLATEVIYGDDEPALDPRLTGDELAATRARAERYVADAADPVTGHIYADRAPRARRLLELLDGVGA